MPHPAQSVFRRCIPAYRWHASLIAIAALCAAAPTTAAFAAGASTSASAASAASAYTGQIIVRWRDGTVSTVTADAASKAPAQAESRLQQLRERTGIAATLRRPMGGNMDLLQVPCWPRQP